MSQMSELDIMRMNEEQGTKLAFLLLLDPEQEQYDDESCCHCGSRNFERLDAEFECYDCGQLFNERS